MTSEDLFRAIGAAEEKDLIQAQKKRVAPYIWLVTAVVVILAVFLLIHRPRPATHSVLEEKPGWDMTVDIPVIPKEALLDENLRPCFVVHARLLEVLPDTYLIPEKTLSREPVRVVRLQILETIIGKDVPKELFLLTPADKFPELGGLDLIIRLDQLGVENYLLLNTTSKQYETFSLLFAGSVRSHERTIEPNPDPTKVSILYAQLTALPFRNGVLSWPQDAAWAWAESYFEYLAEHDEIPLSTDSTLSEAKAAIRENYNSGLEQPKVRYADEYNFGILLTDPDTPKEGIFSQIIHQYENKILLCRIVDGFYTNECYMYYDDGRIEASDTQFTKEEIAMLPDLVPAVEQVLEKKPENATCRSFVSYYYKTDKGNLFGVVQAVWETVQNTEQAVNMLVKCDGSVSQVSTGTLNTYLQGDWEAALIQEAWDQVGSKAYDGQVIYENRGEYVGYPGRSYYLTPDSKLICSDYWQRLLADATWTPPQSVELPPLLAQDAKHWTDPAISYQTVTENLRHVWVLRNSVMDMRYIRYLMMLEDGTLLLALGHDYTGVYQDSTATKTIEYIVCLQEDGDAESFFGEWAYAARIQRQAHPDYYDFWKTLSETYN